MDAKITLSFNEETIIKAKEYASKNNISLSRLTEFLLTKVTFKGNSKKTLEEIPISDWVDELSDGKIIYRTSNYVSKSLKNEYFNTKK
jgi:Family of unknown function (DUF6364)